VYTRFSKGRPIWAVRAGEKRADFAGLRQNHGARPKQPHRQGRGKKLYTRPAVFPVSYSNFLDSKLIVDGRSCDSIPKKEIYKYETTLRRGRKSFGSLNDAAATSLKERLMAADGR